jgi:hypothetical protein
MTEPQEPTEAAKDAATNFIINRVPNVGRQIDQLADIIQSAIDQAAAQVEEAKKPILNPDDVNTSFDDQWSADIQSDAKGVSKIVMRRLATAAVAAFIFLTSCADPNVLDIVTAPFMLAHIVATAGSHVVSTPTPTPDKRATYHE